MIESILFVTVAFVVEAKAGLDKGARDETTEISLA
ncbi:hypothetical protein J2S78_002405 [Salibacterium salarium]|nr:hypothetical protein [Salibacterium salarium]